MNLTGEISDTSEIDKFRRCHRLWVVKLFIQPLLLCLLQKDSPSPKTAQNSLALAPLNKKYHLSLHQACCHGFTRKNFYKGNISLVEMLPQWGYGHRWSHQWKFCYRWVHHNRCQHWSEEITNPYYRSPHLTPDRLRAEWGKVMGAQIRTNFC